MASLFLKLLDLVFPPHKDVETVKKLKEIEVLSQISLQYSKGSNTYTALSYKNPEVRSLIKANKFHKDKKSAQILGKVLEEILLSVLEETSLNSNSEKPIVIPIPSSRKRFLERDGNQVEWIIRTLDKDFLNSFTYANTLLSRKDRKSQTHVPRSKREENIKNAFFVNNGTLINQSSVVFLIDDVSESGATMRDAMRALKKSGVKEVIGVALAK